jgi:hypothetical protein
MFLIEMRVWEVNEVMKNNFENDFYKKEVMKNRSKQELRKYYRNRSCLSNTSNALRVKDSLLRLVQG